jgi:hypothetical protein
MLDIDGITEIPPYMMLVSTLDETQALTHTNTDEGAQ